MSNNFRSEWSEINHEYLSAAANRVSHAAKTIISDKDRQIEELKTEKEYIGKSWISALRMCADARKDALEMAELVSILHPLGHDRAQEIIEKYTEEL